MDIDKLDKGQQEFMKRLVWGMTTLREEEKQFMERVEAFCKEARFPQIVNEHYSLKNWTYKKLCIPEFSDRHKFWLLVRKLKTLRYYLREKDTDEIIIGALVNIIAFCLVWIYILVDWETFNENNSNS